MIQLTEDAMSILRLLLAVVLIAVIGAFTMGYLSSRTGETVSQAGVAASTVGATLEEAALTTKIKAKMALDDSVKARSIDVTTRGTTVTLSGIVKSKTEHDRAMALARETDGVTDVIDNMKMLQPVG
jgi:hyperosmotically inducible periplasmic protein